MNEIDDTYLQEARKQTVSKHPRSRLTALIAAVIALMALTATAFAAEEIFSWFQQYFSQRAGDPLTPGQIQFIEENELVIGETQTRDAYEIELNSVLSDGETVYMTFSVTAPEDEILTSSSGRSVFLDLDISGQDGKRVGTYSAAPTGSDTTPDNTLEFMLDICPGTWNEAEQWTVRIRKICVTTYDRAYEQKLLDTKYAGQSNILFTDEEGARIYQQSTLAEGPWEFTVDLSAAETETVEELEMITAPVTAKTCYGWAADGTLALEEVSITSFILRPLSATIRAQSIGALDFTYDYEKPIFAVMKDGSRIRLLPDWGSMGEQQLKCESPIVLSEVDYILMPDGTEIMAP